MMKAKQRVSLHLNEALKVVGQLQGVTIAPDAASNVALTLAVAALTDAVMISVHGDDWDVQYVVPATAKDLKGN